MSEVPVNTYKAKQLYLLSNLVNLGLYTFVIFRFFNIGNFRDLTAGSNGLILLGFVLTNWFIRKQAEKTGNGLKNPIQTIKLAKTLFLLATGFFLAGVFASFVYPIAIYLSVLCIPLKVSAIALTLKDMSTQETDVIDDFTIEDH